MLTILLIGFVAALAAPFVFRAAGRHTGRVLALVPAAMLAYTAALTPGVLAGRPAEQAFAWVPSFGVNLTFHVDGLALLFLYLITGLGTLVVLYAGSYLQGNKDLGRFYLALLLFMSAMVGLVTSSNLIALFVFWELTSFSSYLLIGFKHDYEESRTSALQALLVTGMGGLALLGGLLLLGQAAGGTFDLTAIRASGDLVRESPLYVGAFWLIIVGCFTKSAQFPFHFWLPNAMAAPTPVSAYLHSATMVKAGIYLLMRLDSTLGATPLWTYTLSIAGGVTMLIGAVWALRQTDLKKVLAYSTVTALGTLTLLVGLSFEDSLKAAVVFLLVHALYKGALFLVAGAVDHETGTRDILTLGGLRRKMALTAAAATVAGLSMAGVPPLFGFVGKELAYKAKLGFDGADILLPGAAVVANALTVAAAGLLVVRPFFGSLKPTPREPHEAPADMWIGPLLLAAIGLVFGLVPTLASGLVGRAVEAILGGPMEIKLSLWYGFNTALLLSVLTAASGVAAYLVWDRLRPQLARMDGVGRVGPERGYFALKDGMVAFAERLTGALQNGSLRGYVAWIVGLVVVLPAAALLTRGGLPAAVETDWAEVLPHEWVLAGLIAAAALTAVLAHSRTLVAAAIGIVGFSVALLFLQLGAPDLAMTQLLVETLIVVIILLVLRHLPVSMRARLPETGLSRGLSALLAVGAGIVVTTLALAVTANPFDATLSEYYAARSVPDGFGRNLVNVILVDFRALDTLGEITVLVVAALGAHVLVTAGAVGPLPHLDVRGSVILRTGTRLIITLLFVASLFLLWRGHNEPGGGFIGGLVAAGAFALYLSAFGSNEMRRLLRVDPRDLMGWGLAIAVLSGLFALFTHEAFMTGQWTTLYLGDGIAPLKLGTPLLFDIGVFLVVIGFTLTTLLALEDARPTARARAAAPAARDAAPPADAPSAVPVDAAAVAAGGPGAVAGEAGRTV